MIKLARLAIFPAAMALTALPLSAQEATGESDSASSDDAIVVTGEIDADDASTRERVVKIGRQITRRSRSGQPIARFDEPLCLTITGMPTDIAELVKGRIAENIEALRGVDVDDDRDCTPNAFLGFFNNVDEQVAELRKSRPQLFSGLKDYQVDRIFKGSSEVRAWHLFDVRNSDGTQLPGSDNQASRGGFDGLAQTTERATRLTNTQLRTNIIAGVVLMETSALSDKTLLQVADYATFRMLASVSDDVTSSPDIPETILTLFNEEFPPASISPFDMAYLEALYELPVTSRDGTVIAAAVSRYVRNLEGKDGG